MIKRLHRAPNLRAVLTVALGLLMALVLATSVQAWPRFIPHLAQTANTVEELQKRQQQIDQQRSDLNQKQDQVQHQEQSAQKRLGGLQTNIKATAQQIAQNEKKLQATTQKLKQIQAALAKAEQKYQGMQLATTARLRFLQRQQISQGWAVLLQSQNLNEFLDRRYQLSRIYQNDRTILANLQTEARTINQKRREVEADKNKVAILTQELLAQKSDYEAQAKSQQALISRLRQDRKALEAAEEQLDRDSQSIALLIQQRDAASGGRILIRGLGLMSYPSDGVLTSGFGYRMHPILGYVRFHSGVDFGAEYGSTIRAANTGVVIYAGWYSGYGQAVIIDHGNNISTLYGHCSQVYVSEGQTVQRGQPIAAVGSSGLSTGPHLHFEVRLSGAPVDPMRYF